MLKAACVLAVSLAFYCACLVLPFNNSHNSPVVVVGSKHNAGEGYYYGFGTLSQWLHGAGGDGGRQGVNTQTPHASADASSASSAPAGESTTGVVAGADAIDPLELSLADRAQALIDALLRQYSSGESAPEGPGGSDSISNAHTTASTNTGGETENGSITNNDAPSTVTTNTGEETAKGSITNDNAPTTATANAGGVDGEGEEELVRSRTVYSEKNWGLLSVGEREALARHARCDALLDGINILNAEERLAVGEGEGREERARLCAEIERECGLDSCTEQALDVVLLWVNGSDPEQVCVCVRV